MRHLLDSMEIKEDYDGVSSFEGHKSRVVRYADLALVFTASFILLICAFVRIEDTESRRCYIRLVHLKADLASGPEYFKVSLSANDSSLFKPGKKIQLQVPSANLVRDTSIRLQVQDITVIGDTLFLYAPIPINYSKRLNFLRSGCFVNINVLKEPKSLLRRIFENLR